MIHAIYEELSRSQCPPRCCLLESLKRSHKGQDQAWLKFWWVEYHSLYSYNMMQANSDALSYSQEGARCCHLNMTYFKMSDKGQHRTRMRFWCGEYLCKIMKQYREFLQSYCVHKGAWPWASSKVQKGHTKVNVELLRDFYVEKIHIKLQHDTGNLWRVIEFTRYRTPPAQATTIPFSLRGLRGKKVTERWNVKFLQGFDEEGISVKLQYDAGNSWKVIVFTGPFDLGLDS